MTAEVNLKVTVLSKISQEQPYYMILFWGYCKREFTGVDVGQQKLSETRKISDFFNDIVINSNISFIGNFLLEQI